MKTTSGALPPRVNGVDGLLFGSVFSNSLTAESLYNKVVGVRKINKLEESRPTEVNVRACEELTSNKSYVRPVYRIWSYTMRDPCW